MKRAAADNSDDIISSAYAKTQVSPRAARSLTLKGISTAMGALGVIFIAVVVVLVSLNERQTLFREAREHARNTAFFLADHAQRLFEVSDIALRSTAGAVGTLDWDSIERSTDVWNNLRETDSLLPYVDDIWLNDASGRLRLTTFTFPTPASTIADRPIFATIKQAGDRLVIGERIVGRVNNKPTFLVARRLADGNGGFRGVVSVTLELSYFTNYWKRLDLPNEERIAVVRAGDGAVLTTFRNGALDELDPDPLGTLQPAIQENPEAGSFQPARETFGFYHRVGDLPLYMTIEFSRAPVLAAWHDWLLRLAPLVAAAVVGLVSIMLLVRRQGEREAEAAHEIATAQAALAHANQTLERRVVERTADLEESNKEIQRFAYIVSHDLRAPLVNITGFTSEIETLRDSLFSFNRPDETIRRDFDEAVGFIQSSIAKMDGLIKAILTLSREGRRIFHPEAIDLTLLLQSIIDGVAHRLQRVGATVDLGRLPLIVSDRIAAEQIFANLIDNAVKYLQADVPGAITVTGVRAQNGVTVRVADNGRGIDMNDKERVFELFRRAGPQDQPGDGIGLAHVRSLVRRLGGSISLESTLGQGSTFIVELPDMTPSGDGNLR